jgi:hypothetical protein
VFDTTQIQYKTLPLWLIYAYYFEWVGLGGRGMGGAYTFAHKEGHHRNGGIYRPWIANTIGNFWENWMGFWCAPAPHAPAPPPPPFPPDPSHPARRSTLHRILLTQWPVLRQSSALVDNSIDTPARRAPRRYGNVPFNFSTSHIFLHHRLNGGKGDSFYQVAHPTHAGPRSSRQALPASSQIRNPKPETPPAVHDPR